MEINMYIDKYRNARLNLFKWRYNLSYVNKIVLALSFALLTGILAQFRFYIPGTPVPVTGQVFGVMLAGVMLGLWGGVSQLMYLGIGAAGLPWFAGFNSGLVYMTGPTGGYMLGFVLAAFFIGYMIDKYVKSRKIFGMAAVMMFSTFVLIYIPGTIWFYFWSAATLSLVELTTICIVPFIAADLVKAIVAAGIATSITPKTSYANKIE